MHGTCLLADGEHSESYLCRLRKQVYETGLRRKPHGFRLVAGCGNPRCIAFAHIRLQPWKMFRKRHAKRGPGSLADTVRDIRHLNELTQTEFGKLVGVSQAAICKWEAGIDRPGLDILSRLVELSDIATAKKLVKASGLGRFIDVFNKKLESDNAAQ